MGLDPDVSPILDACLKVGGAPEACIGQGADACRNVELGAPNPIQQGGWCDQAEAEYWKVRRTYATTRLLGLLRGAARADFLAQQARWAELDQTNFPCDRVDRFWPVGYSCTRRNMHIKAIRAIQVKDSLSLAQECLDADSAFRIDSLCADVVGTK